MHDGTDSPDGQAPQAAIVFKDACVKRGGRVIWRHGSFSIPSGSVTAIVGTNGAGKTTMMKAELGLIDTTAGSITVLGKPAGAMNQHIGYVPQSYAVDIESNLTAEQSVLLGLTGTRFGIHPVTRAQREKARKAMEFVGLLDKASYRLSELSGGLRQRAAIAQALVSDPQLLMLDEPLANLDLASQRATVHVLAKLNRELGMTIQVVAHDLNMLLPILTGAVYLLDGHPHYARMNEVLDSELLTHLYGTTVQVVTTPQGDMFVTPSDDEPRNAIVDAHRIRIRPGLDVDADGTIHGQRISRRIVHRPGCGCDGILHHRTPFHIRFARLGAYRTARSHRCDIDWTAGLRRHGDIRSRRGFGHRSPRQEGVATRNRHRHCVGLRHWHGSVFCQTLEFCLATDAVDSIRIDSDHHHWPDHRLRRLRHRAVGGVGAYLPSTAVQLIG